jgi:hypothetical protein
VNHLYLIVVVFSSWAIIVEFFPSFFIILFVTFAFSFVLSSPSLSLSNLSHFSDNCPPYNGQIILKIVMARQSFRKLFQRQISPELCSDVSRDFKSLTPRQLSAKSCTIVNTSPPYCELNRSQGYAYTNGKRERRESGWLVWDTTFKFVGEAKFTAMKVPRQCQLVLFVKVGWRRGKTFDCEEGRDESWIKKRNWAGFHCTQLEPRIQTLKRGRR